MKLTQLMKTTFDYTLKGLIYFGKKSLDLLDFLGEKGILPSIYCYWEPDEIPPSTENTFPISLSKENLAKLLGAKTYEKNIRNQEENSSLGSTHCQESHENLPIGALQNLNPDD